MGKWMVGLGPWLRGEIFDERSSKRLMGFYEGKRLGQKLIWAMNISGKEVVCRGKSTYHSLLDNATAVMVDVLTVLCWDIGITGIDPYWVGLS